ncbi:MAG TPA: DoxX family protein [Ktedonobacterales bacterium]|nr:DoxX family protein [Ktedonobacterales bacterium]
MQSPTVQSISHAGVIQAKRVTSALRHSNPRAATTIPEPPLARFLFADRRMAWVWLIVRVYAGYEWFAAGFQKMTGTSIDIGTFGQKSTPWVFTTHTGAAITGFSKGAIAQTAGQHPNVQGWYASFLQTFVLPHPAFWAYLITFGELAVGLGLIFGILTGIAAFFGVFMNLNYVLAGAVSTNPILGFLGLFLILAWRIAGYYGADRYLLPLLGTPWTGSLVTQDVAAPQASGQADDIQSSLPRTAPIK